MNKNEYRKEKRTQLILLPIILMIGFVPLIVHMYSYNSGLSQFDWFPDNADAQVDFFFAWKMIAIIILAVIMICILLYQYGKKEKELKFENSLYCFMIYALFVGMSALFSSYKYWVVRGTYELFEPVWVVFGYMIFCYYVYNFVEEEKQIDYILRWSGIGIGITTVIGVFQYFDLDFFKSFIGKHLITNIKVWSHVDTLTFNFADRTSYCTLYNPNFLSFYFGMFIPLLICLFIGTKKVFYRILIGVAEIFCIICLIGSSSLTGWIALALVAVIILLVLLSRQKKLFVAGCVISAVGIIAVLILCNTTTVGKNLKNTVTGTYHSEYQFALQSIKTDEDDVELNIRGNKLRLSYEIGDGVVSRISCKDSDGNELKQLVTDETNHISSIDDKRFREVQLQAIDMGEENNSVPAIGVTIQGVEWDFINGNVINLGDISGYVYVNAAGKPVKCSPIKSASIFKDDAMSLRGHMWNNILSLLGKHVFMGSGANTLMFEYPQNDYVGQAYIYGLNNYEVKAHSWYLQQWVETGLIGTVALIIFLGCYLVHSIRIYRRVNLYERLSWIGIGLFAAVFVYVVVALTNDSNVCTAPVFWGMLGLGMSVNRMLVKKENLFIQETMIVEEKKYMVEDKDEIKKSVPKNQSRKQRKNSKK